MCGALRCNLHDLSLDELEACFRRKSPGRNQPVILLILLRRLQKIRPLTI
jgi:hypothetical protein